MTGGANKNPLLSEWCLHSLNNDDFAANLGTFVAEFGRDMKRY
jgi:hypothetical protein